MIPMRHSTIFKSRWMALLWAAGIIWFALDVAGGGAATGNKADADAPTDATGSPVTAADAKALQDAINGI